jgi:serine/threonine protein kinase
VHGDVKHKNILLFESNEQGRLVAKISDFGSSGVDTSNEPPRGFSDDWVPPEYSMYSEKLGETLRDIYSFGLVCGYIATNG